MLQAVEADFNHVETGGLPKKGKYEELPVALAPAKRTTEILYGMSVRISKESDGNKFMVLKYVAICRQGRAALVQEELIKGTMCSIHGAPGRIGSRKTFQYMFEQIPGIGWRCWPWPQPRVRAGVHTGDADVAAKQEQIGYATQCLKDAAPRGDFDCEQAEWLECELVNPGSPLQDLRREVATKVLQKTKDEDHVALKQVGYPLLLPDIKKEYLELVGRITPLLLTTALLLIGEPGHGKTQPMITLAFAMARRHADQQERAGRHVTPATRVSSEISFFS